MITGSLHTYKNNTKCRWVDLLVAVYMLGLPRILGLAVGSPKKAGFRPENRLRAVPIFPFEFDEPQNAGARKPRRGEPRLLLFFLA